MKSMLKKGNKMISRQELHSATANARPGADSMKKGTIMNSKRRSIFRAAGTAAGLVTLVLIGSAPAQPKGKPGFVDVIVQFDGKPGKAEVAAAKGQGATIKRQYKHMKMLALTVPVNALPGLAQGKGVRTISVDESVEGFSASARATAKVPTPGSPSYVTPASDVAIAVLDSGISDHLDINLQTRVDIISAYAGGTNVRDEFNSISFGNNDGSGSWSGPWQEIGESNGYNSGEIEIEPYGPVWTGCQNIRCASSNCLIVEADRRTDEASSVRSI